MDPKAFKTINKSIPRLDVLDQLTGRMVYGVDMKMPGMLYGKIMRSPHAHAKIVEIDTSAAEKLPGVHSICKAEDFPYNAFGFSHMDQPLLAEGKVRYVGEPVVAVAADTEEIADEALNLIKVTYEQLPVIIDPIEALKPDACPIHEKGNLVTHIKFIKGDIDKGFAESDEIIEEHFKTPSVEHVHLEPHVAIAQYSTEGEYTVWTSAQRPFTSAEGVAKILKVPQSKIRIVATKIGGGFGGKNEITMEPVAMVLARKAKRPVKIEYSREDEFLGSTNRHAYHLTYKTGFKRDGTFMARHIDIISDSGAYVGWGQWTLQKAGVFATGPYNIPHVRIDGRLVYTNKTMGGAMRGFGTPQVGFAYEAHMDTIAKKLNMDPADLRFKNIFHDGSITSSGQVLNNVNLEKTLRKVVEESGWYERRNRK
ncbi:MAG: molybdopterin cofactor-binding domain-containing protein [Bacillota bacterium]|nr:molybdopterin cofactor-binding domain-containing protein [Bacillota bacterium]